MFSKDSGAIAPTLVGYCSSSVTHRHSTLATSTEAIKIAFIQSVAPILSRYSTFSARTYRCQYSQPFAFAELNQHRIAQAVAPRAGTIAAIACLFVPKKAAPFPISHSPLPVSVVVPASENRWFCLNPDHN